MVLICFFSKYDYLSNIISWIIKYFHILKLQYRVKLKIYFILHTDKHQLENMKRQPSSQQLEKLFIAFYNHLECIVECKRKKWFRSFLFRSFLTRMKRRDK